MKHLLWTTFTVLATLSIIGCKPKDTDGPDARQVAGTYIGTTSVRHYTDAGGSGIHWDSATYADTIVVNAVGKDSFLITRPVWEIAQPAMAYDYSDSFYRKRGAPAFNSSMDELTVRFNRSTHELALSKFHVMVSSQLYKDWTDFTGIRQ